MQHVTVIDASAEPAFDKTWRDFGLVPALAEAVRTHKGPGRHLEQVSTIQREIMKASRAVSVYGISGTGTGKLLGMVVPALDDMLAGRTRTALVLAITNPLLDQHIDTLRPILEKVKALDKSLKPIVVTKAHSKSPQTVLNAGPTLVFSTPFQILEASKKSADFRHFVSKLDYVIIDEVDGVVEDPTFGREVTAVMAAAVRARLIAVTATHTEAALAKVRAMAHQPVLHIIASKVHRAVIEHTAVVVHARAVLPILAMLLSKEANRKVMVFCCTGAFAELAWAYCVAAGIRNAARVHPSLSEGAKKAAQREFQTCKECVVFSSNFLGRGMDFEGVDLVVQIGYAPPDLYMQRAGRTGRGLVAKGRSTILLTEEEHKATTDAISKSRGVHFDVVRAVPDTVPHITLPEKVVSQGYKSFLGAYKGVMRTLGWRDADVFRTIGDIITGAGFKVPMLDEKYLRKVGLRMA